MNERINELYHKAHEGIKDQDGKNPQYFSATKFAKLIVLDTLIELEASKKGDIYTGELFNCEWNDCIDNQITMLKEHFGVE